TTREQKVPCHHQTRSRILFRRFQKFEAELMRLLQIAADHVKHPGAAQDRENMVISKAPRQLQSAMIGLTHFRRGVSRGGHQRGAESSEQMEFLLETALRLGKLSA